MNMRCRHILAIDPSLTCSGWALFDYESERLLGVGKIRSLPPSEGLANRLSDIQIRVEKLVGTLGLGHNDVLITEGETSILNPHGAFKVERVRSIFEAVARNLNIEVPGRINPRSLQSELLGLRGAQAKREIVKKVACETVKSLFATQLSQLGFQADLDKLSVHQDIVDAILIGVFAHSKIRYAIQMNQTIESAFEISKSKRRKTRFDWGKGESNSFGWTEKEIRRLVNED